MEIKLSCLVDEIYARIRSLSHYIYIYIYDVVDLELDYINTNFTKKAIKYAGPNRHTYGHQFIQTLPT